ncbi:MAG: N-terminal cleavage protein [Pedosphaera sp.]|nr:N-terminal cleavage protein [Pedosphaera sp.]
MKLRPGTRGSVVGRAFTVLELMVVVLISVILVGLFMPTGHVKAKAIRIQCFNNLKQDGIAFLIWSSDNGDKFPMQVSTNLGGVKEFAGGDDVFRTFQVMSNELSNPKMVICPADERTSATNWTSDFNNSRVSYFVGLDANASLTNSFLSGDRNLKNGEMAQNGIVEFTKNQPAKWAKDIHDRSGNIAFGDGHVKRFSSTEVKNALRLTGMTTNRLAMP